MPANPEVLSTVDIDLPAQLVVRADRPATQQVSTRGRSEPDPSLCNNIQTMDLTSSGKSITRPDRNHATASLTQQVREQLEKMILRGDIAAGERLSEAALATMLKVSRGPVREATRLLATSGLVTIIHNRGVYVRQIKLEEVLQIYDVRAGLAHVAGRLAALCATREDVGAMRTLWQDMELTTAQNDPAGYSDLNHSFHSQIVGISKNQRLIEFHSTTERELALFVRRGVGGSSRLRISNQEHLQIVDAIAAGDETAAAREFEMHIIKGKQRMLDSLR